LPLLLDESDANPREHFYFYYYGNSLDAIRKGRWKLVLPHSYSRVEEQGQDGFPGKMGQGYTELALYDLRNDPGERYDVKDQNPEVMKELDKLVEEARQDLGDGNVDRIGKNIRKPGKRISSGL